MTQADKLKLEELEGKLQTAETQMEAAFERNDEPKFEIFSNLVARFEKQISDLSGNF